MRRDLDIYTDEDAYIIPLQIKLEEDQENLNFFKQSNIEDAKGNGINIKENMKTKSMFENNSNNVGTIVTSVMRFQCDLCSYSTNKKVNLDRHRRTHTGERPFACEYCNYRASNNSALKTHMRTHQKVLNIKSVEKIPAQII